MKMGKILIFVISIFFVNNLNAAYVWSEAIPQEVHIVPEGLVLVGQFNRHGVNCATAAKAIFLPKDDKNFNHKLSLALTAKTTQKKIRVLLNVASMQDKCKTISAAGNIPIAYHYYWQLKD